MRGSRRVEQEFYQGLLLPNGVYKTTCANRMDDLMPALVRLIGEKHGEPIRILDVACSSGISTVEMHEAFRGAGYVPETIGTDLLLFATYVLRADGVGMLFDHDRNLLQVEIGKWASPWRWRWTPCGSASLGWSRGSAGWIGRCAGCTRLRYQT